MLSTRQREEGLLTEGNSFYSTSRSIRATESALCPLLIDSLRLHQCKQLYDFTQAIPHFHSINLSNVSPVSIMEQLLPLLYFISQSAARPLLSLNHQHSYPMTSAATSPRSCILHASYSKLPEGHMANFKIGHIHSIINTKNEPLHSLSRSANIFKSLLTRLKQVSSWSPINL